MMYCATSAQRVAGVKGDRVNCGDEKRQFSFLPPSLTLSVLRLLLFGLATVFLTRNKLYGEFTIEQFSIDCRKTKTKLIASQLTNLKLVNAKPK